MQSETHNKNGSIIIFSIIRRFLLNSVAINNFYSQVLINDWNVHAVIEINDWKTYAVIEIDD